MPTPFNGSGFTNLSNIINANKDNQLGQTIQGGVQKGISGLQSGLNQSQQQFQTDVNNNNSQAQNQQQGNLVGNTISQIAAQGQQAPQQAPQQTTSPQTAPQQQAEPAPTPATSGPSALSQPAPSTTSKAASTASPAATNADQSNAAPGSFGAQSVSGSGTNTLTTAQQTPYNAPSNAQAQIQQWAQGGYSGPTQLQNYATLQGQAQNLQQQGQQVNTPGGLQALLQQYVGGPQYNRGEQTLDSVLLGQTGKQQLQNVLNSTQGLSSLPQNAERQAEALAQQTATSNQAFGKDILGQIQAAQNPILSQVQQQAQTQNEANTKNLGIAQQIYGLLNGSAPNTAYQAPGTAEASSKVWVPPQQKASPSGIGLITVPGHYETSTQANYSGPGAYLGTTYGQTAPVRVGGSMASQGPVLSNQTAASASSLGQADAALKMALQNGLISQSDANSLSTYLANQAGKSGGNTPQSLLQSALSGYTSGMTAPDITQQQAATMQQAAQLSALQQLAGQTPTFNTYGGAQNITPSFDTSKINGYNPGLAALKPVDLGVTQGSSGGFDGINLTSLPTLGEALTPGAGISPGVVPGGAGGSNLGTDPSTYSTGYTM